MPAGAAAVAMLGAAFCFAAVEWVAAGLKDPLSTLQIVWTRYGVQLLAIGAVAAAKGWNPLRTRRLATQIACSLLMVGMPAFFVIAAGMAPVDSVWAVFWLTPLLTMGAAVRWLGERAGGRRWALAAIGFTGVLAILRPLHVMRWEAAASAVAMAACFSGYLVLTRTMRAEPTVSRLFYTALGVFVVLTPFVPRVFRPPTLHDWFVIAAIGLLGLGCLWCIDVALDAQPAASMAPFLYGTPAFVAIMTGITGRHGIGRSALAGVALTAITLWACGSRRLDRWSGPTG